MEEFISENGLTPEVSSVLYTVFMCCDENEDGFVHVSKLISYLKEKANGSEVLKFLDDLTAILDVDGNDPSIDWNMCSNGLQEWIQVVNEKSFSNSSGTASSPPKSLSSTKMPPQFTTSTPADNVAKRIDNHTSLNSSTYSTDSINGAELSWDQNDIHGKVEELEVTNKRLLEDNTHLKFHLHNTEDQNSIVLHENDNLKSNLVRCEKMLEENKKVYKSYEELKLTVVEYQNLKNDLINKTCQLEKENTSLQQIVSEYEDKITKLDFSLGSMREENAQLTNEVFAQKSLLNQIESHKISKESIVEECESKSDYMSSLIAELSLANEVLKAQKNNLENELSETKQDMCRISIMNAFNGGAHNTPFLSSTKRYDSPSLDQEMRAEMNASIGGNDIKESLCHHFDVSDVSDMSTFSFSTPAKQEKYSQFAQQCKIKFREKKEIVFTKIEEIADRENQGLDKTKTSMIVEDLNQELESFTEKIAEFAQGKQTAEKRAFKLAAAIKRLKEENKELEDSRDKALSKYGDLSITSEETKTKLNAVTEDLIGQQKIVEQLKCQVESKEPAVLSRDTSMQCCFEDELVALNDEENVKLQTQVKELMNLVEDYETRNLDSSRKIFDLEETLAIRCEELSEKQKSIEQCQRELSMTKSQHFLDLQAILTTIPNQNNHGLLQTHDPQDLSSEVKNKLLDYINNSIHQSKKLLGVRESPEGGSHSSDTCVQTDELHHIKQKYLRSSLSREHINNSTSTFSQTDLPAKEVSTQTDLDMLTVNKMYDDFVARNNDNVSNNTNKAVRMHSNIPERLWKHNSIDMTGVTTESSVERSDNIIAGEATEKPTTDNCTSLLIEEDIVHATIEDKLHTGVDVVIMESTEQSNANSENANPEVSSSYDYTSRKSSDIAEIIVTEHFYDFSTGEVCDENNNSSDTKTNNTRALVAEDVSQNNIENTKHLTKQAALTCNDEQLDNLDIAKLVEYDRSDISSDSEGEGNKTSRRISITRSRRNRNMNARRSRSSVENESLMEEQDKKSEDLNTSVSSSCGSPGSRRRRVGVSAEPVRVSWSTLRESYKQEQMGNFSKPQDDAQLNTETDKESISTADILVSDISEDQLDSLNQSVPSIEIEEHDFDNGTELTSEQVQALRDAFPQFCSSSPNTSLQVPALNSSTPLSSLSESEINSRSYIEDKDLEKKFNNIAFSFKTDQYTLQKRIENQERARDVSESGMDKEIAKLSAAIKDLRKYEKNSSEFQQVYCTLYKQADILRKAAMKISAQSEQHGSYQQEHRMTPNIEVVIQYADTLRFNMTKLKTEVEEYKRHVDNFGYPGSSFTSPVIPTKKEKPEDKVAEFLNTEETVTAADDPSVSTPPSFRHSFSSISKTLLATTKMSRLRQRSGTSRPRNCDDVMMMPPDDITVKKSVSFGEPSFNDDESFEEINLMGDDDEPIWSFQRIRIPDKMKAISWKVFMVVLLLLLVYIVIVAVGNSLEVDTFRLHDKLLNFIPHTIEPSEKGNVEAS